MIFCILIVQALRLHELPTPSVSGISRSSVPWANILAGPPLYWWARLTVAQSVVCCTEVICFSYLTTYFRVSTQLPATIWLLRSWAQRQQLSILYRCRLFLYASQRPASPLLTCVSFWTLLSSAGVARLAMWPWRLSFRWITTTVRSDQCMYLCVFNCLLYFQSLLN